MLARAVYDFACALLGATVGAGELFVRLLTLSAQALVGQVALSFGMTVLRRHGSPHHKSLGKRSPWASSLPALVDPRVACAPSR